MGRRILFELMNTQLQNTSESYNAKQSTEWGLPSRASPGEEKKGSRQHGETSSRRLNPTATGPRSQKRARLRESPGKPQLGEAGIQGHHHLSEAQDNKQQESTVPTLDPEVTLPLLQASAPASTYTALRPVDVEEGEGEQGFVPFFGQQLLLELNKVGFQVNHLWSSAIGPKRVFKSL